MPSAKDKVSRRAKGRRDPRAEQGAGDLVEEVVPSVRRDPRAEPQTIPPERTRPAGDGDTGGGALASPGFALASPGGAASPGDAAASPGGAVTSLGGAAASPGGAVTSLGGAVTSLGGAAASPGVDPRLA